MFSTGISKVDIWRAVAEGVTLAGRVPVGDFSRLHSLLFGASPSDSDAAVQYELSFCRNNDGRPVVCGTWAVVLTLQCQRCLEPVRVNLGRAVALECVGSEAAALRVRDGFDPLLVSEDPHDLSEIIEDEILLALPVVALHPEGACEAPAHRYSEVIEEVVEEEKKNPFSSLSGFVK
jgi:uncharacterized protein